MEKTDNIDFKSLNKFADSAIKIGTAIGIGAIKIGTVIGIGAIVLGTVEVWLPLALCYGIGKVVQSIFF